MQIIFDGGCRENGRESAKAYGSFKIEGQVTPIRKDFPELRTSNEAEMQTACDALMYAARLLGDDSIKTDVEMWGDSQIAVFCLSGKWRIKKPHLKPFKPRFDAVRRMFKSVKLHWHGRDNSVRVLGH